MIKEFLLGKKPIATASGIDGKVDKILSKLEEGEPLISKTDEPDTHVARLNRSRSEPNLKSITR